MAARAERDLDHVGRIMAKWNDAMPDLDVSPQGVIGRLHRLAARLTEELVAVYAEFGLGEGEFDILATLRREGPPYAMSGAVTKRVDRCVEQGLVTRRVSDHDGRGRVVALTPAGIDVIDRAFVAHMANEHRLVAMLPDAERARLARTLESWGRALDD